MGGFASFFPGEYLVTAFLLSIAPGYVKQRTCDYNYFQLQTAVVYILEKALNLVLSEWEFKP